MWYHESEKTLYTGFVGANNLFGVDSPSQAPPLSIWSFKLDGSGSGLWSAVKRSENATLEGLLRARGALSASGQNTAYVLGGTGPNGSALPGMVQFDMEKKTLQNTSTDIGGHPLFGGGMLYVPVFGSQGIFLAIGGVYTDDAGWSHFDNIAVFDPVAQKWYNQSTTGNRPDDRFQHCVAGIASTGQTYEIFVYAGWRGNLGSNAIPFDTIHILTLPAFHWISVPYNPANPKYGHTCHAVGGSQILVVGGADANSKVTSGPYKYIDTSILERPDPNAQALGIFDLNLLTWKDNYTARHDPHAAAPDPNSPRRDPYFQSDPIRQYYAQDGQSAGSFATMKASNANDAHRAAASRLLPEVSTLMKDAHFANGEEH